MQALEQAARASLAGVGAKFFAVAGVRQRHLLTALLEALERVGIRTAPPRALVPTEHSSEVAARHSADADITARKCAGGYVWIEGTVVA